MGIGDIISGTFFLILLLLGFTPVFSYLSETKQRMYSKIVDEFRKNLISVLRENCEFDKLLETGMSLLHGEKDLFTFSELCKLKAVELSCLLKGYSEEISKFNLPQKIDLAQLYKADAVEVTRVKDKIVLHPVKIGETPETINADFYVPLKEILMEIFKDYPNVVIREAKSLN